MSYPNGPQMPYGPPPQPPKQGMSTGAKIGAGCGGCFGIFLILFMFVGCVSVLSSDSESSSERPAAESSPTEEVEEADAEEEDEEPAEEEAEEEPAEEEPAEEEPTEEPAEEEAPATISDGIHRVGDDIDPGIYTTDGPGPDSIVPMCYYARLSGLGGELDDIITNNNIEGGGTVEVSEGDEALELSGGCEWTLQD